MTNIDERIKNFGRLFANRLESERLEDAINYVNHGERGLAFETICDHLSEFEVLITREEYDLAIQICNLLEMDVDDISLLHLKELVLR